MHGIDKHDVILELTLEKKTTTEGTELTALNMPKWSLAIAIL